MSVSFRIMHMNLLSVTGLNISYRQTNLFSDGYHLNSLFEEEESFVVDEEVLNYARFCSERATSLLINKKEICHICFFDHDRVFPCKKDEVFLSSRSYTFHVSLVMIFLCICYTVNSSRTTVRVSITQVDFYVRSKAVLSGHLRRESPVATISSAMRNIGVILVVSQLLLPFSIFLD